MHSGHSTVVSIYASRPSCPRFESWFLIFSEKNSDVAVLTDSKLIIQRTVKSLFKLIEPIQCSQVARDALK